MAAEVLQGSRGEPVVVSDEMASIGITFRKRVKPSFVTFIKGEMVLCVKREARRLTSRLRKGFAFYGHASFWGVATPVAS